MVKRRVNNPKILYLSIAFNRKIVKNLLASNRHEVSIVLNTNEEQGFPTWKTRSHVIHSIIVLLSMEHDINYNDN